MMLNVQRYLMNNAPEKLTEELGIHVKRHPRFPELLHLSYDQLESPKANPIVHECRGLILNEADNYAVVAFPFSRFANVGEEWAAPVDWTSVRVQDKVDGSLLILWYYNGEWNVSTKGSPDASGNVGEYTFTFSELFWKTFEEYAYSITPAYTYMIELTSIYNRVVCQYKETKLTLIGVRNVKEEG